MQLAYNWITTNRGLHSCTLAAFFLFNVVMTVTLHSYWCVSCHMRALWGCPQKVPYTTSCSFLLTSLNFLICVCARLPATASASLSVGCRHLLAASLQQSLLRDMPVILSALLISKLLQLGRGQRWSLPGCWCCQKAAWVSAFRNSLYSCEHLKDLHVITLEKQLFSGNQKYQGPISLQKHSMEASEYGTALPLLHSDPC